MKIKNKNKSTAWLYLPCIGERVEFDSRGKARVKKKIGKTLIREIDDITEQTTTEVTKDDG